MTPNGQLGFDNSLGVWIKNHGGRNAMSAPSKHRRTSMVIKGIDEDYALDKARIDAEGYGFVKSEGPQCCDLCGHYISEDVNSINVGGLDICEDCQD